LTRDTGSDPGLGIDAGGTTTRWALVMPGGSVVARGEAPALSALMMKTAEGRAGIRAALEQIAKGAAAAGKPARVEAGITGLSDRETKLQGIFAEAFGLAETAVSLRNDMYFAYLGMFAPGEGYLVYAGTGSVAAFVDDEGNLHRAGGRGHILDDGGGGFWIARKALRHIWRQEDAHPGTWKSSPMAREIFASLGGEDWVHTREAVYGGERGDIGRLAMIVAANAEKDPMAMAILEGAGRELARLANAMVERLGPRPIGLTGRAALLHPSIEKAMRAALLPGITMESRESEAHCAAARLAAQG